MTAAPPSEPRSSTSQPTSTQPAAVDRRALFINSCVAAVLGSGLMVLLHELTHLLTGLAMGVPGTLYSFGVDHHGTPVQNAITAAAGPLFSLVSGAAMIAWQPLRSRGGFAHLLWLWFAFSSVMEGVGYLEIAPFGAGDTATVVRELGLPAGVAWASFAVGLAGQFALAWLFARPVGRMAGTDPTARRAASFWPWLAATAVNLVLTLVSLSTAAMPVSTGEAVIIALAGMATLVFAPMALMFGKVSGAQPFEPLQLARVPVGGLVALGALVVLNLILNHGWHVG